MDNPRPEKVAVVDEVRAKLDAADAAVLTEYRGLDVSAMAELRRALRDAGGEYKIYKNTLVRFAAKDLGLEIEDLLTGPTAIAFVEGDPVNVAKALRDFAKTNPALVINPSLFETLPFDPVKDFASVSLMATTCYVLSVHPSMPVSNARQLVALAKARPGQLTFSSPGSGTPNHLSGEMLKMLTGIDMQHVPFKGSAQAISDVIGGQIAMSFENIVVASPFVKNGRLKALGVTSAKRASALPSVPTMAESGVPGFEAVGWFGVVAPAATPKDIIAKLNSEMVRMLSSPDVKERISSLGAEVVSTTPEGMDQFNRAQIELWAKVVKASGARAE